MTPSVFSNIPLSSGGEANYLGYTEAKFPQMTRNLPPEFTVGAGAATVPHGTAELESMWMTGFLDYDSVGPRGDPRGALAKDLGDYELRFGVQRAGAVSRVKKPSIIATAEQRIVKQSGVASHGGAPPSHTFLSGAEIQRLRDLEKNLQEKSSKPAAALSATPYAKENVVLRRLLSLRGEQGSRKLQRLFRPPPKLLGSTSMDNLLWLQRLEAMAAIVIQRMWRKLLKRKFWRKFNAERRGQVEFSKIWRGYSTRVWFKRWKAQKMTLVLFMQSSFRGRAERRKLMNEQDAWDDAAKVIQKTYKGTRAKKKARNRARKKEATKIQRSFRAAKGRAIADKMFLDKAVTLQQKLVRGWLSRRRTSRYIAASKRGATLMQSLFRGWLARKRLHRRLWEGLNTSTRAWMTMLKSEEVYLDEQSVQVLTQKAMMNVDALFLKRMEEWKIVQAEVSETEYNYFIARMERSKLSVQAIFGGWATQLDRDAEAARKKITERKAHGLFSIARSVRDLHASRQTLNARLTDTVERRRTVSLAWTKAAREILQRRRDWTVCVGPLERAIAAAQEKRKWALKHFTETGKLDLRRTDAETQQSIHTYQKIHGKTISVDPLPHVASKTLHIASGALLSIVQPDVPPSNSYQDISRVARLRLQHAMTHHMLAYNSRFGNAWGGGASSSNPSDPGRFSPAMLADGILTEDNRGFDISGASRIGDEVGGGGHYFPGAISTRGISQRPWESAGLANPFEIQEVLDEQDPAQRASQQRNAHPHSSSMNNSMMLSTAGSSTVELLSLTNKARDMAVGNTLYASSISSFPSYLSQDSAGVDLDTLYKQKLAPPGSLGEPQYAGWADGGLLQLRPDMREMGEGAGMGHLALLGTEMQKGALGGIAAEAHGKYVTLGEYYSAQFGVPLSQIVGSGVSSTVGHTHSLGGASVDTAQPGEAFNTQDRSHAALLQMARGDKARKSLHDLKKKTTLSRFAGTGPLVATFDPFTIQGLKKLEHKKKTGDGSNDDSIDFGGKAGLVFEGSLIKAKKEEVEKLSEEELHELVAVNNAPIERELSSFRPLPGYVKVANDQKAAGFASSLPSATRTSILELTSAVVEQATLAKLPPGLAGARAGAAASTLAISKSRGVVGSTEVVRTKLESQNNLEKELRDVELGQQRINQLENRISATTGQAEILQYGALTKPIMDGMATVMMQLSAADGTERLVSRTQAARVAQEASRQSKLAAATAKVAAAKAKEEKPQFPSPILNTAASDFVAERYSEKEREAFEESLKKNSPPKAIEVSHTATLTKRRAGPLAGNTSAVNAVFNAEKERLEQEKLENVSSSFLSQFATLSKARKDVLRDAKLKKMGLKVEANKYKLDPSKMNLLLGARDRFRDKEAARVDRLNSPIIPQTPLADGGVVPATGIWGYLEELEDDRTHLMKEYTRPLPFSTKGSRVLGRRHLQVKEEAQRFQEELEKQAVEKERLMSEAAAAEEDLKRRRRETNARLEAKLDAFANSLS